MMVRKPKNRNPRAVGYIRVSTTTQACEGVSLEAQEMRIRSYCDAQGFELIEVVVDAGESAKTLNRPGVQQILEMARTRQVDAVVIYKLDRLFRNTQDALNTSNDFARRGVALCSISEQLDTSSPAGRFFFTLIAAFAEMERALIAERTREGLAQTRRNGRRIGDRTPYGYDFIDGLLVPNEAEQTVIRYVTEQYAAGIGTRRLARDLTAQGVKTKEGGTTWHPSQVQRLIGREERYGVISSLIPPPLAAIPPD